MADLCLAIRAGASPVAAARLFGVTRSTWKKWNRREGEPYDTLRRAWRQASAYCEVNLEATIAKRSPREALKLLRRPKEISQDRARYIARMAREKPHELLGLTLQEELFCKAFVAVEENAIEAVRRVGTFKARTEGSMANLATKLMRKPGILARVAQLKREELAIHERKHRTKVDAQRVLEKRAALMNADIRRVASVVDGRLTMRDSAEWYEEDADAIKSVSQTADGALKVEFHSPEPSIEFFERMFYPDQAPPMQGGVIVQQGVILIPDNGRDPLLALGGKTTNGNPTHREPGPEPPQHPTAIIDFPPRDEDPGGNGAGPADEHDDGADDID